MLTIYENRPGSLQRQRASQDDRGGHLVDLLNPTPAEEGQIERALKLDVPTREEHRRSKCRARLYQEDGAYFMTAP